MPNTHGLNRSLGAAVGAIAIVSLLSGGALFVALSQLQTVTDARARSNQIIRGLDDFRIAMLNQEAGLRGYLLTGKETSLEPYRAGRAALDETIAGIRQLLGGNSTQSARLADAETVARAWQQNVGEPAVHEMADPATRAEGIRIESSGEGKRRFEEFRAKLRMIQDEEERVLAFHNDMLSRAQRNASIALWVSAIVTLLICAAIGVAINRFIAQPLIQLAGVMRRLAQRDLSVEVPSTRLRSEVGEMARAVEIFKNGLIELDRTSVLRATADTLPAMVGYVDANRRIGFLNGEFGRWFNLQAEDVSQLYGRPLAQVFAADAFPGVAEELEAAFSGDEMHFEHQLTRHGSPRRDVEAVYRPHRAPDGRILGVVTLLTDITERKRMERRLEQQARDLLRSNEELEQFAYVASHDLKAPLRGIENLTSWIEEDLEQFLAGDTRTNMDLLKGRVRRLESLLEDPLAYSRSGRDEATVDLVDAKKLVEELAILVSSPQGFSVVASPSLPTVMTARAPLTQALQNLIGNAIMHHDHPADGHVWVDAQPLPDAVEFTVMDDGPGIPERFRDRVFGMFQTLKPRDEVEGSGMGLAIVKKLIDRQGGRIWLTDSPKGRGLAVHFVWPTEKKGT
ncbi:MAG: CHASE3 domain-containing protein [Methylocella sp.]